MTICGILKATKRGRLQIAAASLVAVSGAAAQVMESADTHETFSYADKGGEHSLNSFRNLEVYRSSTSNGNSIFRIQRPPPNVEGAECGPEPWNYIVSAVLVASGLGLLLWGSPRSRKSISLLSFFSVLFICFVALFELLPPSTLGMPSYIATIPFFFALVSALIASEFPRVGKVNVGILLPVMYGLIATSVLRRVLQEYIDRRASYAELKVLVPLLLGALGGTYPEKCMALAIAATGAYILAQGTACAIGFPLYRLLCRATEAGNYPQSFLRHYFSAIVVLFCFGCYIQYREIASKHSGRASSTAPQTPRSGNGRKSGGDAAKDLRSTYQRTPSTSWVTGAWNGVSSWSLLPRRAPRALSTHTYGTRPRGVGGRPAKILRFAMLASVAFCLASFLFVAWSVSMDTGEDISPPLFALAAQRSAAEGVNNDLRVFITACGSKETAVSAMMLVHSIYDLSTSYKRAHVHITHDGEEIIQQVLLRPLQYLLQREILDPRRLRLTDSVTTVPKEMINMFKTCATARLVLPNEHPDVDVGLYLDADTYVTRDLNPLFQLASKFNQTQWVAMAYESESGTGFYVKYRSSGYRATKYYKPVGLNSGVMLFNLTRWRQIHLEDFAKEYVTMHRTEVGDQDIMNAYFADRREMVYRLPCTWNVRPDTEQGCSGGLANAAIVHGSRNSLTNHSFGDNENFRMMGKFLGVPE